MHLGSNAQGNNFKINSNNSRNISIHFLCGSVSKQANLDKIKKIVYLLRK